MRLRKLIIATHRDLGYFFAGMTVLYAISGVAVNHIEDWNPNYVMRTEIHEVGEIREADPNAAAGLVLERLLVDEEPTAVVRTAPTQLKVFLDQRTLTVELPGGRVEDERVRRRYVFYELNFLHLNHGKGVWTWIADVYAVGLGILALTGIFIISGKKGLGGRGRWLLLAGILVPLVYLVLAT
jgi:hypothetical protein